MNSTFTRKRRTGLGAVATVGIAAAAMGLSAGVANAAALPATLSAASGPSAGGNTLSVQVASTKFATGATVSFQVGTACTAAYSAAVTVTTTAGVVVATTVKVLSGTKVAVTVPAGVVLQTGQTTAAWMVCVYPGTNTTTSLLSASAKYSIAAKPTISANGISPAGGPALGGSAITVTGSNFITGLTATLGGLPLTGVTIVDSSHFTAVTPAHAAATGLALSVTTTGGTATRAALFDYSNGIVVSPNTTPTATAATDVDVSGVGFSTLDFTTTTGTTPDNANAHIYLVDGLYDPTDDGSGAKTKGEVGECLNALVISDTELICTVNTAHAYGTNASSAIANGLYTLVYVNDGGVDVQTGGANADANYAASIISSGSAFTVAPY